MGNFTLLERNEVLNKCGGVCACCGKGLTVQTLSIDHYIPTSRGGKSSSNNLYPLCIECNREKGNEIYYHEECYPLLGVEYDNALEALINEWKNRFKRDFWSNLSSIEISIDYMTSRYRVARINKSSIESYRITQTDLFNDDILKLGNKGKLKKLYKGTGESWKGIPQTVNIHIRDTKFNEWVRSGTNTAVRINLKQNAVINS